MKKIIIVILCISGLISADPLADYISQFDKGLAIDLFEKTLETQGENSNILGKLAGLYKDVGKIGLAADSYRHLLNIGEASQELYKDYMNLLLDIGAYDKIRFTASTFYSEESWSKDLIARTYFYEGKFDTSLIFAQKLESEIGPKIVALSLEGLALKPRSAFLGGAMSAIIPGSGKMYAGRFWDGLQSFSMTVAPAYNAYYHFNKTGVKSFQGWLWTAVTSWFYLSDIYGSIKAVQEYNDTQKYKVIEKL